MLLPLLLLLGCHPPDPQPGPPDPAVGRPNLGPGLGNVTWEDHELWRPAAFVDTRNGIPTSPAALRQERPFGTNNAAMHNGWFFTMFASDSGLAGGGLLSYDVSDPRNPILRHREFQLFADGRAEQPADLPRSEVLDGPTGAFREAHSMGFARVDDRDLVMFHTATGVEIWDLTDTLDPAPVSRLDLPGVIGGDYVGVAWQLAWQGRYAYVAGSELGVYVVDARDPEAPVLADRGGLPNPIPPGELGGFRVGPVFAMGNQLVLTSMDNSAGYAVLDITEPAFPTLQSTLTSGLKDFYSTCFTGDRIVGSVRGGGAAMTVHDISDPFTIALVAAAPVIDEQLYCSSQDHFVFQGNSGDVVKVDVSDPANFHEVGRGDLGRHDADHGQVTPMGNLVYVGNDHGSGSGWIPHQAAPDTTPPAVVAVVPTDGAVHQGVNSRVGIAFSDTLDNTSLDRIALRDPDGDRVPAVVALQGNVVNLAPTEPLERGVRYELVVEGVRDVVGNELAAPFTSTFDVTPLAGGDPGAMTLSLEAPAPVAVGVAASFRATAAATGPVELSWRFTETAAWTPFAADDTPSWTYDAPGHEHVFVRATDGTQTLVASRPLTVYEPPAAGRPVSSGTVAVDPTRGVAWVANRDQDTVSRVDLTSGLRLDEIAVGDTPSSVALTPAGDAWVTLAGGDALASVSVAGAVTVVPIDHGSAPCSALVEPTGTSLFVTESGPGHLVRRDAATGAETGRVAVGPGVCGLALTPGGELLVSELRASVEGSRVHRVDAASLTVTGAFELQVDTTTLDGEDRARGAAGYLAAPAVSPSGQRAWVPAVQANVVRGAFVDGQDLTHETTVRAVLPRLDLPAGIEVPGPRLDFNDRSGPMAAVTSPLGDLVYVALLGSREVVVVDAWTGATLAAVGTGAGPRGLAVTDDGRLLVHAWLDRSLEVYDIGGALDGTSFTPVLLATVALVDDEPQGAVAFEGQRLFYAASDLRMSRDGYLSCGSCHLDGAHDGLTWDFTQRGEGLRNTTDLRGRGGVDHGPVHWTANFDEIQDFENDIRNGFGGAGFLSDAEFNTGTVSDPLGDPKAGLSPELDALAAYVASLDRFPTSPFREADGALPVEAVAGEAVFVALGCDVCHAGVAMTDSGLTRHDVGTLTPASGLRRGGALDGLDTPTLRGLWDGAPWLHDGSAGSVVEVLVDRNPLGLHGDVASLPPSDLAALEAYLLSLE